MPSSGTSGAERVHQAHYGVYGARKVWMQLNREDIADPQAARAADLVNRKFNPTARTSCGWPTSPTSRPGRAGSTSRSWSMPTPADRRLAHRAQHDHRPRLDTAPRRQSAQEHRSQCLADVKPVGLSTSPIEPLTGERKNADTARVQYAARGPRLVGTVF